MKRKTRHKRTKCNNSQKEKLLGGEDKKNTNKDSKQNKKKMKGKKMEREGKQKRMRKSIESDWSEKKDKWKVQVGEKVPLTTTPEKGLWYRN